MFGFLRKTALSFNLPDPEYVSFLRKYEAKGAKKIAFYLVMGLIPGLLAYVFLFYLREPIMAWTGLSNTYTQYLILATMSIGWHMFVPFLMLRYADKLSFKQSLVYLGFTRLDLKGLLIVVPIITILFTLLSLPYLKYLYLPQFDFLNAIPGLTMGEWHIYYQGYYDFPWPLLLIGVIGNFIGEEIYFRGYLLRKVGSLKGDWFIVSALFQLYHVWQAPINWAYLLLSVVIPCEILVKLRKNIYGAIVFHVFVNMFWGAITFYLVGV